MVIVSRPLVVRSLGPELLDNFADNPWETIIWACQTGNVPESWTVGSQKPMTINGKDYPIDIIGLYHDDYSDGSGKAPITFQMHDCYAAHYAMNSTNTNNGGWTNCAMRVTRLPNILATMPNEVQAAIREVNKLTSAGNTSSTISITADKLFLLSEIEIFGSITYSKSGEGSRYAYYSNGGSKVKKSSGVAVNWWERSPHKSSTLTFCCVNNAGSAMSNNASRSNYLAFAFCF